MKMGKWHRQMVFAEKHSRRDGDIGQIIQAEHEKLDQILVISSEHAQTIYIACHTFRSRSGRKSNHPVFVAVQVIWKWKPALP